MQEKLFDASPVPFETVFPEGILLALESGKVITVELTTVREDEDEDFRWTTFQGEVEGLLAMCGLVRQELPHRLVEIAEMAEEVQQTSPDQLTKLLSDPEVKVGGALLDIGLYAPREPEEVTSRIAATFEAPDGVYLTFYMRTTFGALSGPNFYDAVHETNATLQRQIVTPAMPPYTR